MPTLSSRQHTWSYLGPFCQTFGPFYQICVCFFSHVLDVTDTDYPISSSLWLPTSSHTECFLSFTKISFIHQALGDSFEKHFFCTILPTEQPKSIKKCHQPFDPTVWWTRRSKFWTRISAKENGGIWACVEPYLTSERRAPSDIRQIDFHKLWFVPRFSLYIWLIHSYSEVTQ